MILFLYACADDPTWSEDRALAPTLEQLDADGDGVVGEVEFEGVRHRGRTFAVVDADHDGALSVTELKQLFFHSDPTASGLGPEDGSRRSKKKRTKAEGKEKPATPEAATSPRPEQTNGGGVRRVEKTPEQLRVEVRSATLLVLLSLREEQIYAGLAAPSVEAVEAVAGRGSLYTADARRMLAVFETNADAAHLPFPPSLRAAALATRPVEPPLEPEPPKEAATDGQSG